MALYAFKTKRAYNFIDMLETKKRAYVAGMDLKLFLENHPDEVVYTQLNNKDVYISILSPQEDDYLIMYHHDEWSSIWYTEKDYHRVCNILETRKITYEIVEK
jgi:hypothetical protein